MEIFENDGGSHYGQAIGMLLGLAVGDARGAYLEFGNAREGSWRTTSEGIRPVGPQSLLMAGMS